MSDPCPLLRSRATSAGFPALPGTRGDRPSFQLTREADYAVRAAIYLATLEPGQLARCPTIASSVGAPTSFLAKVLQRLVVEGVAVSTRGKAGGFSITERGRRTSMLRLVEMIDGPLLLNTCLAPDSPCERAIWCPAHLVWREAQRLVVELLGSVTVAQLASSEVARRAELAPNR